jgi:hypothetical protein
MRSIHRVLHSSRRKLPLWATSPPEFPAMIGAVSRIFSNTQFSKQREKNPAAALNPLTPPHEKRSPFATRYFTWSAPHGHVHNSENESASGRRYWSRSSQAGSRRCKGGQGFCAAIIVVESKHAEMGISYINFEQASGTVYASNERTR